MNPLSHVWRMQLAVALEISAWLPSGLPCGIGHHDVSLYEMPK